MPPKDPEQKRVYDVAYRRKNQDKLLAQLRSRQRKLRTGWTSHEVEEAFAKQGGKCWMCRVVMNFVGEGSPNDMCADHSHVTGTKRGLLCRNCNFLEGFLAASVISPKRLAVQLLRYWRVFGR